MLGELDIKLDEEMRRKEHATYGVLLR